MRIIERLKKIKKWKYTLGVLLFLVLGFLGLLNMLAHGAAYIFNEEMHKQELLQGTIHVDKIVAHINGHVRFENLEWLDPVGNVVMVVPSGEFDVRIWDVVTHNIKSTTLQSLTLNDAVFVVRLNEKMQVDFLQHSAEIDRVEAQKVLEDGWEKNVSYRGRTKAERRRLGAMQRSHRRARLEQEWRNYEGRETHLKLKLKFNNCKMEAFARGQHYILSHVNIAMNLDTEKRVDLKMSTGTFGGTMIGLGMAVDGNIDFTVNPVPVCNLNVRFNEVSPSSLGIGMNIKERMTLSTHMEGPVIDPQSNGTVQMPELHIPGLDFYNLNGFIHLNEAKLIFDEVTADVFDGKLVADGTYDFDTRSYVIRGHGTDLQAAKGLPKAGLSCPVELDLIVEGEEDSKKTVVKGDFVSSPGDYRYIPFKQLSGTFRSGYKDLQFWNVEIDFYGLTVKTPGFRIKEGHLTMEPIDLYSLEGDHMHTIDLNKK